jgi:hypothetical protein
MDPLGLNFIDLNLANVVFLLAVGFIGGLVSGFIGSGGAFVLTPAMMSIGVPGRRCRSERYLPQVSQAQRAVWRNECGTTAGKNVIFMFTRSNAECLRRSARTPA